MSARIGGAEIVRTYTAGEAVAEGAAVVLSGAGEASLPSAAGSKILGVTSQKGDPSDVKYTRMPVVTTGEADALAGGTISEGDLLTVTTAGKLITATGGQNVVAIAREDAVADQLFAVLLLPASETRLIVAPFNLTGTAPATAANFGHFFTADRALKIIGGRFRVITPGSDGGAVTAMLKKVPSGTAMASGTDALATAMDLKTTANTNAALALHATAGNITLAAGDSLALVPTGTLTALAGLQLTVELVEV
ncbi:MAG: hypothetical protein GC160_02900 [Acidobacteria bacterium]|nr:hypothetical protein [Acidobacteriota bacterium]